MDMPIIIKHAMPNVTLISQYYRENQSSKCADRLSGNEKQKSGQLGKVKGHNQVYPPNIDTF